MKKQLFALLISVFTLPSTSSNIEAGAVKKTVKGTFQVVKIGAGLVLMAGGTALAIVPCACCPPNQRECNVCCCKVASFVVGVPTAICGGLMVKSGIKKLAKLMGLRKKKHKEHHHHTHVYIHQ